MRLLAVIFTHCGSLRFFLRYCSSPPRSQWSRTPPYAYRDCHSTGGGRREKYVERCKNNGENNEMTAVYKNWKLIPLPLQPLMRSTLGASLTSAGYFIFIIDRSSELSKDRNTIETIETRYITFRGKDRCHLWLDML